LPHGLAHPISVSATPFSKVGAASAALATRSRRHQAVAATRDRRTRRELTACAPKISSRRSLKCAHYSCRASCGGLVVLVDEAAESVAAADFAVGRSFSSFVRRRGSEFRARDAASRGCRRSRSPSAHAPASSRGGCLRCRRSRRRGRCTRCRGRGSGSGRLGRRSGGRGCSAPRRRMQLRLPSSRRMLVGDTRKPSLASSPQIRRWPQRGVLAREPQHQLASLGRQSRPPALTWLLSPLPANKRLMPAQNCPRSHQKRAP
jgi:hypothetical protein